MSERFRGTKFALALLGTTAFISAENANTPMRETVDGLACHGTIFSISGRDEGAVQFTKHISPAGKRIEAFFPDSSRNFKIIVDNSNGKAASQNEDPFNAALIQDVDKSLQQTCIPQSFDKKEFQLSSTIGHLSSKTIL